MIQETWASVEDFATLFQYFWYRDFPMDQKSTGARRSDWTIHTGIVVRNIADIMGFMARFESGKRKDAVMRSTEQDEIALEWEWDGVWGNEVEKLRKHRLWSYDKNKERLLKYAVFITYTHAYRQTPEMKDVHNRVMKDWEGASCPLLLILIEVEKSKKFFSGREFQNIQMSVFQGDEPREIRLAPALPWKVAKTRWSRELK